MEIFDKTIINIILIIGGLSTVILLLEASGFLPYSISKFLIKNKLGLTREVLKDLGIQTKEIKKTITTCLTTETIEKLEKKLKKISYSIKTEIGETTRGHYFNKYIDLMGVTTKENNAKDFAGILKSYVEKSACIDLSNIDLVVTSKLGSPILGYEFAKNIKKHFILHSHEIKFRTKSKKFKIHQKFDTGGCDNLENKTALIVEDSTTGGRKVIEIIEDLRENNIIINDCLVIFAPQGKNADKKLSDIGVTLHTMIKTHQENLKD